MGARFRARVRASVYASGRAHNARERMRMRVYAGAGVLRSALVCVWFRPVSALVVVSGAGLVPVSGGGLRSGRLALLLVCMLSVGRSAFVPVACGLSVGRSAFVLVACGLVVGWLSACLRSGRLAPAVVCGQVCAPSAGQLRKRDVLGGL